MAEIHRAEIGHLSKLGDPLFSAPDSQSRLWADSKGNGRFEVSWDDDGESKLHMHRPTGNAWTLINDSIKSGIDVIPLGFSSDGNTTYLLTDEHTGLGVVQRYDLATGARTDVYRNDVSDPIKTIHAFHGNVPVGGYYGPTDPKPVIWNPSGCPGAAAHLQRVSRQRGQCHQHFGRPSPGHRRGRQRP